MPPPSPVVCCDHRQLRNRQIHGDSTYLDRFYASGHLLFSGPQTTRTGGVILGCFDSEDEAWEMVRGDPFYTRGLATYDVISFRATKAAPEFRELLG